MVILITKKLFNRTNVHICGSMIQHFKHKNLLTFEYFVLNRKMMGAILKKRQTTNLPFNSLISSNKYQKLMKPVLYIYNIIYLYGRNDILHATYKNTAYNKLELLL